MSTNLEGIEKNKELGEGGWQTSTHKKEPPELTISQEQEFKGEEHSEDEDITVDIMSESAVAEDEQRVYESQVKEETQALRIIVIKQHLKHITDKKENSRLQGMITTEGYLMQNDKETKEKEVERLN